MAFMIVFSQESEPKAMDVSIAIMRVKSVGLRMMQFRPLYTRAKMEYVWA